jgi:hypothetical protein
MSRIWAILRNHKCWLGIPHKNDAGEVVMVCYGCGKTKRVTANLEAQ